MLEINGGAAFTMRGARPPVYLKEKFLNRVVKCYFPASTAIEGYWSQVSQAAALQRVRKVQKEKKLSKFFGVDESKDKRDQLKDQMHRQFTPIVAKAEDLAAASATSTSSLHHLSQEDLLAMPIYSDGGASSGSEQASPTGGTAAGATAAGASAAAGATASGAGDDDLYSRKKRADKLAEFFGKKVDMGDAGGDSHADLPLPGTAAQPNPRPRGISAATNGGGPMAGIGTLAGQGGASPGKYGKGDSGKDDVNQIAQLPVATLNELPSETKAMLTRRSKKLRHVLGEALDENTAYDALLREVFNPNNPLDRRLSAGGLRANAAAGGIATSTSYQGLASAEGSDEEFMDADPFMEDDMTFAESDLLNSSDDDDDDPDDGSSLMSRERPVDPNAAKLRKVQRRGKLQQILGEGKLPASVGTAQQGGSASGAGAGVTSVRRPPATKEQRREQRKRVNKLEKMFGQLPPTEALTETQRRTYEHRKSILSISRVLTDTKALANVLEHLASTVPPEQVPGAIPEHQEVSVSPTDVGAMAAASGAGSSAASAAGMARNGSSPSLMSTAVSVTSSDTESTDGEAARVRRDKVRRKQKFNKLAKFFGGQLDPTLLIEQNIIGKLEREIEQDMAGDESSMTILRQDLAALREQVKEVARDLVSQHESAGDGDHDSGGSATMTPRSRSKSGRRTQKQTHSVGHGASESVAATGGATGRSGDEAEDEFEDASSVAPMLGSTDVAGKAGRRTSTKSGRSISPERRSVTSTASDHPSEMSGRVVDSTQSSSRLLGSQP
ncbi:hypothetical protein BCR44DRAFT_1104265 [Catenaria anguillulae PL171]|uniref:Uncharacterized protein n=1 Tax=Catenaria anguillulae PL171 TaxID=765915 RepID=A0A1Y2I4Q6_9FUNG|nr:hypothetical protein BCR44DRAFT_1104265 [Catenaria anguillulae PL171]